MGSEPVALVGLPGADARAVAESGLAEPADGASVVITPGEVTLVLPWRRVADVEQRFSAARIEGPFRMLTLDEELPWNVVGFFARVAGALADAGIVIGALSSFSRDHVLVKEADAAKASEVLSRLEGSR